MAIIDKPSEHFETSLYTGTGSSLAISGLNFAPDFTWIKGRSGATEHVLTDSVRGVTKELSSNDDGAEETVAQGLTAFGTDGFTVGTDGSYNTSSATYASWNWKAGTAVSGATTGAGTAKTYTGSVNTTSGFSIIKYTGNGTAGHTIPHNLGVTPSAIFVKGLVVADWTSYHSVLGNTGYMRLNNTNVFATASTYWNNTSPTSSVFTLGTTGNVNANGNDFIAYCFAEVKGYSKFGSFIGNGSTNGTFVHLGMKPAFVMIKKTTGGTANWITYDNKRLGYNPTTKRLIPNLSDAEQTITDDIDFLSNGFKLRTAGTGENHSGQTHIYMAFAEQPFVTSTANGSIPATAR